MIGTIFFTRRMAACAVLATVSHIALTMPVSAQNAPAAPSANSSTLPPVVIQSPAQRQARPKQARRSATAPRRAAARRARNPNAAAPAPVSGSAIQQAYAPVTGYVATQSFAGTKTATPLMETPQSISVVTRDQIEAQNAQSAKEALRYTAGVQSETRANFGGYDITYGRGFILNQYLDGMRLQGANAYITPQPEIYGLDRVEYLRGPASVLYGQGSPGGFLNLVSKMPQATQFNEAFIQGGSYGRVQGGFDSTGKIDKNGEFLYRVTGFAKDADNQVNFVKDQRYYIAPALTWRPTNDTTWTILTNYQRDPNLGYFNFVPYFGSVGYSPNGKVPTSFYAGDPNLNKLDRTSYSVTSLFEHRFNEAFTVRQNTRYMDTWGNFNQVLPVDSDGVVLNRINQATKDRVSALSTDTQGEFRFNTGRIDHKVLVGIDTQNTLFKETLGNSYAPDLSIANPVYFQPIVNPFFDDPAFTDILTTRQSAQQVGFYGQDQIKIGKLSVVGGLRYDWARSNTQSGEVYTGFPQPDLLSNQKDHATTGRVGAIYNFDSGVAPFVTYATSFDPAIGVTSAGQSLKPTTGALYEAGVKYQPPGYKAFIQASVFDLTQQNVVTADPTNPAFKSQIGEVRSRGFEIEGKASINRNLDMIASYTYVRPEVTKSLDVDLGHVPVYVPRVIGAIWGDYTIREGALNGLGFALGVRHIGQTYADLPNLIPVPSYTLVDAAVHYDLANLNSSLKGARFSVNATNLFDKDYVSQCTNVNPSSQGGDDFTRCVYGLRRQVIATLRYRW